VLDISVFDVFRLSVCTCLFHLTHIAADRSFISSVVRSSIEEYVRFIHLFILVLDTGSVLILDCLDSKNMTDTVSKSRFSISKPRECFWAFLNFSRTHFFDVTFSTHTMVPIVVQLQS